MEYDQGPGASSGVLTKDETKVQKPRMYQVLLLNDDFTPMDFVIYVLKKYFKKNEQEAHDIMMKVHNDGAGLAGVFTHEIAETKVFLVNDDAKKNDHPLKTVMQPEEKS